MCIDCMLYIKLIRIFRLYCCRISYYDLIRLLEAKYKMIKTLKYKQNKTKQTYIIVIILKDNNNNNNSVPRNQLNGII